MALKLDNKFIKLLWTLAQMQLFYSKTTADFVLCLNFDSIKYLIIFAMEKENVKRISIWDKVQEWMKKFD